MKNILRYFFFYIKLVLSNEWNKQNIYARYLGIRFGNNVRILHFPRFGSEPYLIEIGNNVTITTTDMTRFLLSLDDAVDVIFAAMETANRGETYIPRVPSANMLDLAKVLIGGRKIEIKVMGIRPGEKVHEILISDEESFRTVERGKYYAIKAILRYKLVLS